MLTLHLLANSEPCDKMVEILDEIGVEYQKVYNNSFVVNFPTLVRDDMAVLANNVDKDTVNSFVNP